MDLLTFTGNTVNRAIARTGRAAHTVFCNYLEFYKGLALSGRTAVFIDMGQVLIPEVVHR
jgi:hypothetical protein